MFETKKYVTMRTMEKLRDNGLITKFSVSTISHIQHLGYRGNVAVLDFEPTISIHIVARNGDSIELIGTKKKKSYRIDRIYVNNLMVRLV